MTLQFLPDDTPIRSQILPSVWAGYQEPSFKPAIEMVNQTSKAFQMGYNLSKEEADKLSTDFWTGSIHDFCAQYLNENLTNEDHIKILQTADSFIKNGSILRIDENETDLIKLLSAKVVLNAHQRANHAMSNACFLNEYGMLPKENVFMLQKGISPIFYEKDEFDRAETLKNRVHGVPENRILDSFTRWTKYAGMKYISAFRQMSGLLDDMKYINALILKKSIESYMKEKRRIHHFHRPRPIRRSWRGRA